MCLCIYISTDIFASVFKSESGVLEVRFSLQSYLGVNEHELAELHLEQYGGPEAR